MNTQVARDQGKTPVWGDTLSSRFNTRIDNVLGYKVLNSYSSDQKDDKVLGYGSTQIDKLHQYSGQDIQMPFLKEGKNAGHIVINVSFQLDNVSQEKSGRQKELEDLEQ